MKITWLALGLLCLSAAAQEIDEENEVPTHPLTDMPDASQSVEVSSIFPKYPDRRIPLNEPVTLLGGFSNQGKTTLNITTVMGSVNSPFDFSFYLLNMTKFDTSIAVPAETEHSFAYTFQIHPQVSAAKFRMAVTVFYEDEEEAFSTTFFNRTVEFYDPGENDSGPSLWLLLLLGGIGFVAFKQFNGQKKLEELGVPQKLAELGLPIPGYSSNVARAAGADWEDDGNKKGKKNKKA